MDISSNRTFHSNGKLMLSGEYIVLEGALSLSVPLVKGQELVVKYSDKKPALSWKTYIQDEYWFTANYSLPDLAIGNTNDFQIAQNLRKILLNARVLNKEFLKPAHFIDVRTNIDFNINWGLGSSSSLIANIARWANIDPFDLHFKVSEGSGYDIAAAISSVPVLYRLENDKPVFERVNFYPQFHDKIFFAYLGKKQNSARAVADFKRSSGDHSYEIEEITKISQNLVTAENMMDFIHLFRQHDEILSGILNVKTIAETRYKDFKGYVKSLGAWGGDFAMFITDYPKDYLFSYFRKRDIVHWFAYKEIVK